MPFLSKPAASPSPSPSPRPGTASRFDQIAPFIGVASTSKEESLRVMNGRDHYDEWMFVAGRPRVLGRDGPILRDGNIAPQPKPGSAKGPGQTK